jgi:hypothetical protein
LANGLIPEYATAVARVMHVSRCVPWELRHGYSFRASSVDSALVQPSEVSLGRRHQAQPADLLISLASLPFHENENALHAKVCSSITYPSSKAFAQTRILRFTTHHNAFYRLVSQVLLFVWITHQYSGDSGIISESY